MMMVGNYATIPIVTDSPYNWLYVFFFSVVELDESHICTVYARRDVIGAAAMHRPDTLYRRTGSIRTRTVPTNMSALLRGLGFGGNEGFVYVNYTHHF